MWNMRTMVLIARGLAPSVADFNFRWEADVSGFRLSPERTGEGYCLTHAAAHPGKSRGPKRWATALAYL